MPYEQITDFATQQGYDKEQIDLVGSLLKGKQANRDEERAFWNDLLQKQEEQISGQREDQKNQQQEWMKWLEGMIQSRPERAQNMSMQGQGMMSLDYDSFGFEPLQGQQASVMPGRFPLTQAFGNYNPRLYRGVTSDMRNRGADFAMKPGTPLAVPKGQWVVTEAFGAARPGQRGMINKGYGNSVMVKNVQTGEMMRFSHLNKVGVRPGQVIQGGTLIGLSGDTGNATGAHLDLEFYTSNGRLADVLRSPYARNLFGR